MNPRHTTSFLPDNGEMSQLIRAYNWADTSIGPMEEWPQSLKTTLSILVHSRFPMFLFWGEALLCFYNDAYRPSLGNEGKHPSIIGMPASQAFPEIWATIEPQIQQVLSGGPATWYEDQLLPIYRNGQMEDVYWTYSYSPVLNEAGKPGGILVTCSETTDKVFTFEKLEESKNQLEFAIEAAEMATWDYNPTTGSFTSNARLRNWFGLEEQQQTQLEDAIQSIVEEDRSRVLDAIQWALNYDSGGFYNVEYSIENKITSQRRIVHVKGRAWFNEALQPIRFNGTMQDVTEQAMARKKLEEREEQLKIALQGGELGTFDYYPHTDTLLWSDKTKELFGLPADAPVNYATYVQALHPEDRNSFNSIARQQAEIERGDLYEIEYRVNGIADGKLRWLRSKGKVTYNEQHEAIRYTGIIQDVTQRKMAEQALRTSEQQLRSLVDSAPFPIGVYIGEELRIQLVNQAIIDVMGKGDALEGKLYTEVLPELVGTGIYEQLLGVLKTGISYKARNQKVDLMVEGQMQTFYFNYDFTPLHDANGRVYGVMNTAADVTDLYVAKQRVESSEKEFRQLADSLPVMVWTTDQNGKQLFASKRWKEFTGLDPMDETTFAQMAHPDDLADIICIWSDCLAHGKPYKSNVRLKSKAGDYQWFYVHGEPILNSDGVIEKWIGAYTNINEQKKAEKERETAFKQLESSEKRFRNTVQQAPLGITILSGEDFIVEMANDNYLRLVDKKQASFVGKRLYDSLPEVEAVVGPLLTNVYQTGTAFFAQEFSIQLNRYGISDDLSYFNLIYHPLKDETGATWGVMVVATEVTDIVKAKQLLVESERQFRNLVMQSPVAMTIFQGPDLVIEIANNVMVEKLWRKNRDAVIGKKLLDVFPELQQQKFPGILVNTLQTGQPYGEKEAIAYVQGDDGIKKFWLDYDCLPMPGADGNTGAVMVTVSDVTERVLSRQIVEESEQRSRLAIEAARMGTFDWDLTTNEFIFSKRLAEIFGFPDNESITHQHLLNALHPDDKPIRDEAVAAARVNGSLSYEARVRTLNDAVHWIKVYGKLLYNEEQQPVKMYGTVVDITGEKANVLALEENTARLNIAIDSAELGMWELDLQTRDTIYNERFAQLMGFGIDERPLHEEMIQKIHPDDLPRRNAAIKAAMENGLLDIEMRIIPRPGILRWIKTKGKVFYDSNGVPVKMLGTIMETTEARNSYNILQESEERFRNVANNAPVLIWMAGNDLRRNFFNIAWLDFRDRTMEQEFGHGWVSGVHPDDMAYCFGTYAAAFQAREPFFVEFRLLRNDGQYRWVSDKGVPRFTQAGEFEGYIGASLDVHDDKLSSEKIMKSELLFKTISNVAPVGLWMTDVAGNCTFVNDTWTAWTGLPPGEQMGENWLGAIVDEDKPAMLLRFQEAMEKREKLVGEFRILRPDGSLQWCLDEGSPYYDIHGNFAGFAGSVTDITERKLIEKDLEIKVAERTAELKMVNDALEKSNTELEQFAYVASHDLQEPLRKIRFFTERLENVVENSDPAAKEFYQKIQRATDRMNRLIKDLLDFSRLSKSNELFGATDLAQVIDHIKHDLELLIQQKNATLLVDQLPIIEAVPLQMQQLFYNLLSNSVKFSKPDVPPVIRISCTSPAEGIVSAHGLDESLEYCLITVSDNGIGFEQEYAEQIFVIFQRLNDLYTYGGTGIGLALCKKIVLNHKGKIYAEGIEGQGATFYILLPMTQQP